jgi:hypothetical protein
VLASGAATVTTSWPGVCPPTSMSSMPAASVDWPVNRESVPSARRCARSAISSGSLCAAKWRREASGEVQKAYSASVITSCACGNCRTLPMWSQCACVITMAATSAGSMPSSGSDCAGVE